MHQAVPASVLIHSMSEKVLALAKVVYEGSAEKEGGVVTALKTWLKAISLTVDTVAPYPCWTTDDMSFIDLAIKNLEQAKNYLEKKLETRFKDDPEWLQRRIKYAIRDIKWILNKLSNITVTPIDERVKAMCIEVTFKPEAR